MNNSTRTRRVSEVVTNITTGVIPESIAAMIVVVSTVTLIGITLKYLIATS